MPKVFTSQRQKTGELGEEIASAYLIQHGFDVVSRNYTKRLGEIDIIAKKSKKLYFIEVKSVSMAIENVTREINIRPEDNMHHMKLKKLYRTIEMYLMDNETKSEVEWQIDLICVYLDQINRKAKVRRIENIIG